MEWKSTSEEGEKKNRNKTKITKIIILFNLNRFPDLIGLSLFFPSIKTISSALKYFL